MNRSFQSLDKLNKHIRIQLDDLNNKSKLTGMDINRREMFKEIEKNTALTT